MFPIAYGAIYNTPENYHEPDDTNIATNTEYPNLNSRDYTKRPSNRTLRMYNTWECLTLNEENQISLATNKLAGREWHGSLWGFEEEVFEDKTTNTIVNLKAEKLLLALHSGYLQVWSTRSEVRNIVNPYCMFMIGEKCEHLKPILCLDVMKTNSYKAITGGKDCTLKVWDAGKADLSSINTFRYAHSDVITDVDSSPQDASIFATCSLDRSAILWDDRLPRSANAIYENHPVRFKAIAWFGNEMYVGDEAGKLHSIDIRKPKKYLKNLDVFDRPIRKILPSGSKTAIIGDTNIVKATDSDFSIIYENSSSQHFVRDVVWQNSENFLTVGFDGKMRTHTLK